MKNLNQIKETKKANIFNVYTEIDLTGVLGIAPKSLKNDSKLVAQVNKLKAAQDELCANWIEMKAGYDVTIKEIITLVKSCIGNALELVFQLMTSYPDIYTMIEKSASEYVTNALLVEEQLKNCL